MHDVARKERQRIPGEPKSFAAPILPEYASLLPGYGIPKIEPGSIYVFSTSALGPGSSSHAFTVMQSKL